MVTLALYNLKGGVGKTAATINLAYLAAKEGYKTLIWDMDPQGSSSFYLGAKSTAKNESQKLLNSQDRKSTRLNSSHPRLSRMPSSA